jgi:hypothetical protein
MQTVGIVLNVGVDRTDEFEAGFREMEGPIWQDFHGRGVMQMATLSRLDITTKPIPDAVQYLVVVVFATDEGHELHDADPRFNAWNKRADTYQIADPYVFGGETIVHVGP